MPCAIGMRRRVPSSALGVSALSSPDRCETCCTQPAMESHGYSTGAWRRMGHSRASHRRRCSRTPSDSRGQSSAQRCPRPCVGKSKRFVSRLPPAHTVSIRALPVGIEDAFIFPQAIEKSTRLGEPRVLPRHDLRPGPVDVEDLRLPSFQRGEVLVETPLLDFQLFVVVLSRYSPTSANQSCATSARNTPRTTAQPVFRID
jgi:hypothetical protein